MASRYVVPFRRLPSRLPVTFTAVSWLLMDRLQSAGWVRGVAWTLIALLWIVVIFGMVTEEARDVFPGEP